MAENLRDRKVELYRYRRCETQKNYKNRQKMAKSIKMRTTQLMKSKLIVIRVEKFSFKMRKEAESFIPTPRKIFCTYFHLKTIPSISASYIPSLESSSHIIFMDSSPISPHHFSISQSLNISLDTILPYHLQRISLLLSF